MALLEANRQRGSDAGISQWVFDGDIGRISARDAYGNLVMAFAADSRFGPRLAAAFNSPAALAMVAYGARELGFPGLQRLSTPRQ